MPPPTSDEWRQIAQIFESAVELPPTGRSAFLDSACPANSCIRGEVERMLSADQHALQFLESDPLPEWAQPSFTPQPGAAIGAYRLIRELGSGGMAYVWLAERNDGAFQQQVAIKFSRASLIRAGAERRLRAERDILAQLQHPHIARLLDGGAVGPGVPYFVMEYVDGETLPTYAASHQLPAADRLRLFADVCHAVHFAHQRLIVHRDLKPANILVDRTGRVHLLDFGVAKLLEADTDAGAPATVAHYCTPAYASPEQLRCEPVTTASDIYSLGRILDELVPATADLASIVRFALQPNPDDRYPSARALAEDVERFLQGLPVSARPDTLPYRTTRFIGRHRLLTLAFALVLALLAWQWSENRSAQRRAERHLADLHRLALHLLFDYHDEAARLPGSTALRARITADALTYLRGLAEDARSEAALTGLARDIAGAWLRLGDVQGRPYSANRGDTQAALNSYRQAEEWARRAGSPRLLLATALQRQGQVETRLQNWPSALRHLRAATALLRDAATDDERLQRVSAVTALGDTLTRSGSPGGLDLQHQALALAAALPSAVRARTEAIRLVAIIEQRIGLYLTSHGDVRQALAHHHASLAAFEDQLRRRPGSPGARRDYADQLVMKAETQARAGDRAGALADCDRGIALFNQLLAADPSNIEARRDLGYAWYARAAAASIGGPPDCVGVRTAASIFDQLLQSAGPNKEDQDASTALHSRLRMCR